MKTLVTDLWKETHLETVSRRSVLRNSLQLAAAAGLMRPYIANAAATTATVWWTQGFVQEEDIAITKMFDAYQRIYAWQDKLVNVTDVVDTQKEEYKEGFVPPGTLSWNVSDNNNAFHSKQIVMDIDGRQRSIYSWLAARQ
jgi:hypothetical protein